MDTEWTDGESGQMFGKFQVVKTGAGGNETVCTTEDYSVNNLPGNSILKQLELYVGNSIAVQRSTLNMYCKQVN